MPSRIKVGTGVLPFMKKIISLIALIGLTSPLVALADDNGVFLSNDFFDAEYRHTYNDADGVGQTNGLGLGGSHSLTKTVFAFLDYDTSNTNVLSHAVKSNTLTYGLGARTRVAKDTDLVGKVSGVYRNVDSRDINDIDDRGINLTLGLRTIATELLEVDVFANFQDNDYFDDGWTYNADFIVPLGCSTALKTTVAIDDDSNVGLAGGFRFAY